MDQSSLAAAIPPIPRKSRERERTRHARQHRDPSARRHDTSHPPSTADANDDVFADWTTWDRERYADRHLRDPDNHQAAPVAPASPEVISSLITSLSSISRPVSNHFDSPSYLGPIGLGSPLSLSLPGSPKGGSFGVDYGAYAQPSLRELREEEDVPLGDLPASAPVIRTSKPPSGLSALTAPKSPRSPGTRDASGIKGLLSRGSSRPSSRGSLTSGAESIGKPSIERLQEPLSPGADNTLRSQRSYDSWGRKGPRNQRGVMYMSSKEQLREKEAEKKRASIGAVGGNSHAFGPTSGPTTPRLDPLSVESVINEEPNADSATTRLIPEIPNDSLPSPRLIPVRDSSLRKTGNNAKRSSARTSRTSKRDSDGAYGAIPELEEQHGETRGASRSDSARRRHPAQKQGQGVDPLRLSADLPQETPAPLGKPRPDIYSTTPSTPAAAMFPDLDAVDDGAPSPAVAQGRRRDREASAEYRRRSGRHTPDPLGGYTSEGGGTSIKVKRSSTRLKRLSGTASLTPEKATEPGAAAATNTQSDQPHIAYERPRSADSIDDAVESYLCSPRLSQKIRHPQTGRVVSFSEVGDPNGSAVFCCVGMGLTRYITAFYDELALTLRLRLITPDRPGVGDSEPYAEGTATPLGWPDDVYAICQSLKITKFSILAHSAGAIYALATALRMPQHIRGRIHLLAPWIPPSQMNVFGASAQTPLPPTNAIPTSQRILRALPTPILKAANSSFMTATSSSITSSLPKQKRTKRDKKSSAAAKDKENKDQPKGMVHALENKENVHHADSLAKDLPHLPAADENMDRVRPSGTSPPATVGHSNGIGHRHRRSSSSNQGLLGRHSERDEHMPPTAASLANSQLADRERQELYDNRLTHAIWQLATTGANPAVDLLVCLERRHTIGFRYVDITRPVVIHHGSRDTRVPVDNVRWLGKTMKRCEVRVLEGEGHGLMASAQVMGGVLMEISREWEEWGRVTGATKREGERGRRGTIGRDGDAVRR
ncbi:AB hydrolase-1 domain-containing protein [Madurella fahalii]|uniref:AB hydrolase-1 domain-containing protein n=1 Tax=Madurella fahalii TaxID=1157608 RepID=A0ABQ0GFI7_9PEZI